VLSRNIRVEHRAIPRRAARQIRDELAHGLRIEERHRRNGAAGQSVANQL
jgi:hypothetical protein